MGQLPLGGRAGMAGKGDGHASAEPASMHCFCCCVHTNACRHLPPAQGSCSPAQACLHCFLP